MRPRPAGWLPVEPGAWGAACPASGSGSRRRCGDGPGGPRASLYWQPSTLGPESGEEASCQEFLSVLGRPQPAQEVPGRLREGGGGVGGRQGGGGGGHRAGRAGLLMQ